MEYFNYKGIEVLLNNREKFHKYNVNIDSSSINIIKNKFENKDFVVSIIGAMKAGKSTFVNSILGEDIMPSENAACTLTTTEIINDKNKLTLIKNYESGEIYEFNSLNITKEFHEDIRKSREESNGVAFKYILNHNITSLNEDSIECDFKIVDTPGYNEMSGLGVSKKQIEDVFDKQLRNTDYIIYILDYKYYKSDDNIDILEKIKILRPDIIANNNIVFILNKIDLITYKDGTIDEIVDNVGKLLKIIKIEDVGILPFSAKKALLYKLIDGNKDLGLYENDIENMTEVIQQEVNGQIYNVKMPIDDLAQKFYRESNIEIFEEVILKQLYKKREDLLRESLNGYEKTIIRKFLRNSEHRIKEIVDKFNNDYEKLTAMNKKLEDLEKIEQNLINIKDEVNKILSVEDENALKEKYFKDFSYVYSKYVNPSGSYNEYYSGSSSALSNGKQHFRNWKSTIKPDFTGIYNYYNNLLKIDSKKNNMYFKIKNSTEKYIKELKDIAKRLEKFSTNNESININTSIVVSLKPIMNLCYDNSTTYMGTYDNSEFVDYDTDEEYVDGLFGSRLKTVYRYDISDAVKEEEKDVSSAQKSCSQRFFHDFYKKHCEFINEVKKRVDEEVNTVFKFLEKLKNEFSQKANIEDNKEIDKLRGDIIDMVSIYNNLENIF